MEGEALATVIVNKLRGTRNGCAVKATVFGNRRRAKRLTVDKDNTTVVSVVSQPVRFYSHMLCPHQFCGHLHDAAGREVVIGRTKGVNVSKKGSLLELPNYSS